MITGPPLNKMQGRARCKLLAAPGRLPGGLQERDERDADDPADRDDHAEVQQEVYPPVWRVRGRG